MMWGCGGGRRSRPPPPFLLEVNYALSTVWNGKPARGAFLCPVRGRFAR